MLTTGVTFNSSASIPHNVAQMMTDNGASWIIDVHSTRSSIADVNLIH